jgi:hypothetical protein
MRIAIGIEVWGLPVLKGDALGTVNFQLQHNGAVLKNCEWIVSKA